MLLIYQNEESRKAIEADQEAVFASVDAIMKELAETGELIGGRALTEPPRSRTVKVRNGETIVTDGPFLEAKEHLAGYVAVDCAGMERAIEIAAKWPDACYCAMEVREVIHDDDRE
ncbi:YciI family protein [Allorhizocola rhizosphaerae]|uniref:YciI family protein n=1 Tax=Allorhizocola rhizosphaerae TaxID=1872709 RepID=UPI001FEA2F4D|nr:YciI family protein [Allorhizocola rhizosphaerae]